MDWTAAQQQVTAAITELATNEHLGPQARAALAVRIRDLTRDDAYAHGHLDATLKEVERERAREEAGQ